MYALLKFVVEGQLIIVSGEEGILVSCPSSIPYVEAVEESLEMSFQALEVVSNAYVESPPVQPHPFGVTLMVARVMLGHGYEPGIGFGQNGNGVASLVDSQGIAEGSNWKKFMFLMLWFCGVGGNPGGPYGEGGGHVYQVRGAATCGEVLHAVIESNAFAQCRR